MAHDKLALAAHSRGQRLAQRGSESRRLLTSKKEMDSFLSGEREREAASRARSGRRPKEAYEDPDGFERRRALGRLEYDAPTGPARHPETKLPREPTVTTTMPDDDPSLFRQSMDMIRLKQ